MLDKVLKAWECCDPFNRRCFECPYEDNCFHDGFDRVAIADMVKLLKEQQPKKPVYDCPLIRCPRCKNSINVIQKYCDECGQAIDWSKDGEQE